MTSETEAKASRYKPSVANTPPLVRGLALLWVMGYFLLTIPFILLTGRFRGQKVHSLTYFSAAALLLAALGVAHNHFHFHKHTYCDMYLTGSAHMAACSHPPQALYDNGAGLVVKETNGVRSLYFGGWVQTRVHVDSTPFGDHVALTVNHTLRAAAPALRAGREPRVVLLGLGGGAMSSQIADRCKECRVTAVEVNPDVIEACRLFFRNESDRLTYVESEAYGYLLGEPVSSMDVVINDATWELVPLGRGQFGVRSTHRDQHRHLQLAHSRVRKGGAYVLNVRVPTAGPHAAPLHDIIRRLQRRFSTVDLFTLGAEGSSVFPQDHVIVAVR